MSKVLSYSLILFLWFIVPVAHTAVIGVNGDRQWHVEPIHSESIKRIVVSGPIYVELKQKTKFQPCNQSRIKIDQNLNQYFEFQQVGDELNIRLQEDVIPSDWVEVRLFCLSLTEVNAENHAVIIMQSNGVNDLVLSANNALVDVQGTAGRIKAVARNGGVLGLVGLDAEKGEISVSSGSFSKMLSNDFIQIHADSGGKAYILDEHQAIGKQKEDSPGVLRVFKNLYIHDYAEAFNAKKKFSRVLP